MSPVPAKARIFISHSATEDEARAVQAALVAELEKPGHAARFALLVDRVTLQPGDMWRSRINLWVGGCDAAIILLSKSALDSPYVSYEASILSYRLAMGDSLLLIPLLLEGVEVEALKKGRLWPAQLSEHQAVRGKTPQEIVEEILERLKEEIPVGVTPLERRAQHLADLLDRFKPSQLAAAAQKVDLDVDRWIPFAEEKLPLRLAVQLLSVGMKASVPALHILRGFISNKQEKADWVDDVIRHIASSWVDPRSVDRLPRIAKGQEALAAVGINACDPFTAEMYVLCASCGDPPDTWFPVHCNGIVGEDRPDQVAAKLGDELERALAYRLGCEASEVRGLLENMNQWVRQPVVVSLPAAGITAETLAALRTRFPYVTFFLLLGDLDAGPQLPEDVVEVLFPKLAPGDETHFKENYKIFKDTVRVPLSGARRSG